MATLSMSDDQQTTGRLRDALERLVAGAGALPRPPAVEVPEPEKLELETVDLPRDAFFGPAESVPADQVVGRVAAEQITPYPPGIPVVVPGQRINREDSTLETFRVRQE